MLKNFIKSFLLKLLKIKLNTNDLNEMVNWQRNSYLFPPPFFIKKEVLNFLNKPNSHWYEISKEKSTFTKYLSKISESVYFVNNYESKERLDDNSNRKNINEMNNINDMSNSISESCKLNKSVFLLIHSNSSPQEKKYNYHQSSLSQKKDENKDNFYKEIFEKVIKLNNLTLIVDDFDRLNIDTRKLLTKDFDFNVISNMLVINKTN